MLLCSIRTRLLGLVLAAIVPLAALVGAGLWTQWQSDRAMATQRSTNFARLLAAQVDNHISYIDSLLIGLSKAVSTETAETAANDAFLSKVKAEQPGLRGEYPVVRPRWLRNRIIRRLPPPEPHGGRQALF